jgi:hypothetical protein
MRWQRHTTNSYDKKNSTHEYWQSDLETLPPEQLEQLQGIRLRIS